jgi:hypothetical protein
MRRRDAGIKSKRGRRGLSLILNGAGPPDRIRERKVSRRQCKLVGVALISLQYSMGRKGPTWDNFRRSFEERTMKLKILGAAVFFALVSDTALVTQALSAPQSIYCATRTPGVPFSRYCNPTAWREWRRRGRWDSRLDNACRRDPQYMPRGCPPRYAR